MELKTERMLLRPVTFDDAQDMYEYCSHPAVGPLAGWKPHESLDETLGILEDLFVNKEHIFGMVYQNKLIGTLGLMPDARRENTKAMMLGYAMSHSHWGKGLMTEASKAVISYGFDTVGLDLITAYHYPDNGRSKRVILKCGFVYEGTLRQALRGHDGTLLPAAAYSITREEYLQRLGQDAANL